MKVTQAAKLPICGLCKTRPANQTGSHIFNHSLIRDVINVIDPKTNKVDGRRNREVAFSISPTNFVTPFLGRQVNNEMAEKLLGRPITDEEIENSKNNPYTVDFFLCTICEGRIEKVESYFMDNVHTRLRGGTCNIVQSLPDLSIATCEGINDKLVRLYIYSLIWRAGEVEYMGFKIQKGHNNLLRSILDQNLDPDLRKIVRNVEENKDKINSLPLKIFYLTTPPSKSTENVIHMGLSKEPYFFMISDICFQLFFKRKHVTNHYYWQWGLSKFKKVEELVNIDEKPMKIGVVSNDFREDVVKNLFKHASEVIMKPGLETFSLGFQAYFGRKPSTALIKEIKDEFNDITTAPQFEWYSLDRFMLICAQKLASLLREKGVTVTDDIDR